MYFEPQGARRNQGIKPNFLPPCDFIAATVDLAMMPSAQGHGELIADLATECPCLGEAQMMWVGWPATADKTRLLGDVANMLAIPDAARLS